MPPAKADRIIVAKSERRLYLVRGGEVMRSYLVRPEHRRVAGWIGYGVLPALGFAMNVWLWSGLSRQTFYVGLGWLALGFCQLLWLTRGFTRPAPTLSMN